VAAHRAREEAGRWPVDRPPEPRPGAEASDYHEVAVATLLGEPGVMIETASRFQSHHPESPFDASSHYVIAVARHLAGHRDEESAYQETTGDQHCREDQLAHLPFPCWSDARAQVFPMS